MNNISLLVIRGVNEKGSYLLLNSIEPYNPFAFTLQKVVHFILFAKWLWGFHTLSCALFFLAYHDMKPGNDTSLEVLTWHEWVGCCTFLKCEMIDVCCCYSPKICVSEMTSIIVNYNIQPKRIDRKVHKYSMKRSSFMFFASFSAFFLHLNLGYIMDL